MEVPLSSIVISIALIAFLRFAWKVLNWVWLRPKQVERSLREQGFKGNSYKLLFGDTIELLSAMKEASSKTMEASSNDIVPKVLSFHHHFSKLHGKNCFVWIGPRPRVCIMDPKLIKEILFNHETYTKLVLNPFGELLKAGILAYEGEEWAKHRNLLNPAFHVEKLKLMVPAMYSSCHEMISKWEALASTSGSCELDVWPHLASLSGDVISRTAFGSNYEEGKRIIQLLKEQNKMAVRLAQSIYIPGWRFLPTKTNMRLKNIDQELGDQLRNIIANKREQAMKGYNGDNDLLGILLKSSMQEIDQNQGSKKTIALTTNEVIEECKLFYIAGQETTGSLLVWTMIMLSSNQKWQDLAREEVLAVFGNNPPDSDGLNQLKTVTMILYEVLRLYSPGIALTRSIHKTTKLGELVLSPEVDILIPILALHHDPEIWGEDATEFKPERFSEGISNATKGQSTFIPFGGGPRICIGQNFTIMEAKIALSVILRRFSFHLSPSYVHAPCLVLAIEPQHGAHLILQKI